MGWLRNLERWFRRTILNPGKQRVADELRANLGRIDEAVNLAVLRYAQDFGGQPLAMFVAAAINNLGLSDAASRLLQSLLDTLGAGMSRSAVMAPGGREDAARAAVAPYLAAVRKEAGR